MSVSMSIAAKGLIIVVAISTLLAIYTAIATWQVQRAYTPIGQQIEVQGIRLHYVDVGKGSAIVLLHGASASLRDFSASIMDDLAINHRVIAFDRPGYGYSERPVDGWPDPSRQAALFHEALQKIGAEKPFIVGHSWAGSVVLAYILDYPKDVQGGILLAGATNPWKGDVSWPVNVVGLPVVGDFFSATIVFPLGQILLDSIISRVFHPETPTLEYRAKTGAILALRPSAFQASAEDIRMLSKYLAGQSLRYNEIENPLLLVTGENDTIVPAWNHAERLVNRLPHAKIVELEGAGHILHHSHRTEVVRLITDFVKQVSENTTRKAAIPRPGVPNIERRP